MPRRLNVAGSGTGAADGTAPPLPTVLAPACGEGVNTPILSESRSMSISVLYVAYCADSADSPSMLKTFQYVVPSDPARLQS